MNRREVLTAMAGMCGAAGVQAKLDAVTADSPATLAIIHCEKPLSQAALQSLHESWRLMREVAPELPPCIVMENGLRLELRKCATH